MHCKDLEPHLLDALKGSPDAALAQDLAEHLASCSHCRELQALWIGLDQLPLEAPDPSLVHQFHLRLRASKPPTRLSGWLLPLAAAVLLVAGTTFVAGYSLRRPDAPTSEGGPVRASLRRGSAADRMQAIALLAPTPHNGSDLTEALLERIAEDPNTQVRLSAVEALYVFGSEPGVATRLEAALRHQDRPEVQLALVDLMAALRERRAVEALRRLLRDGHLGPAVRRRAQSRLEEL